MLTKMKCENCKKELKKQNNKYTVKSGEIKNCFSLGKYNINNMVVCGACYARYKANGTFIKIFRNTFNSLEEKLKFYEYKRKQKAILKKYRETIQK